MDFSAIYQKKTIHSLKHLRYAIKSVLLLLEQKLKFELF